jgi:hypothetical protein
MGLSSSKVEACCDKSRQDTVKAFLLGPASSTVSSSQSAKMGTLHPSSNHEMQSKTTVNSSSGSPDILDFCPPADPAPRSHAMQTQTPAETSLSTPTKVSISRDWRHRKETQDEHLPSPVLVVQCFRSADRPRQRSHSVPVKCPQPGSRPYQRERSRSFENDTEESLQRFYDNRTWNMYYRITESRELPPFEYALFEKTPCLDHRDEAYLDHAEAEHDLIFGDLD